MTGEMIIFMVLALIAVGGAVLLINAQRMAHMVLSMVFVFLAIAGLYFLLRAEFIGIVQIIVYVGAMAILFVFAVMMTEHRVVTLRRVEHPVHNFLALSGTGLLLAFMLYAISTLGDYGKASPQHIGSAKDIGINLYGYYVVAFEAAGILLLLALIGAIVVARKEDA